MKNEFNIKKFKDATVYTLESATSGGTSAGSVASVSSPMGGVRRRGDNLIAQEEKKEAPKPRNFVAKNAKMGGAGQHKDKKKEQKQGNEKHKKPYMEDHEVSMASNELKSIHSDAKKLLMLVQRYGEQGNLEAWQQSKITKAADYLNSVLQSIGGEQGVAEGDPGYDKHSFIGKIRRSREADNKGWGQLGQQFAANSEEEYRKALRKGNRYYNMTRGDNRTPGGFPKTTIDEQGVAEGEKTMSRAAKGNEKYGKDGMKALAKAGRDGASEKKLDAIRDKHDNYNEDSDPCWSSHKMVGTKKKGGKTVPNCVPKESVEEGAVKELSSDLKTMSDEEFQSRYKMSKADARDNLKKKDEGSYYESLSNKLAEKLNPNAPTDVWVKDFQKADPNKYKQFKNKTPAKKAQMAVAAHYAANEPSKKK